MKFLPKQDALEVAEQFKPIFLAGIVTRWDYIIPFNFGDISAEYVADQTATVYTWTQEDENHFYTFYGVFHAWDMNGNFEPPIAPFKHRFDFEGGEIVVSKEKDIPLMGFSRAHYFINCYRFVCDDNPRVTFCVEPNGHGVYIGEPWSGEVKPYEDYQLEHIDFVTQASQWGYVKRCLNSTGVTVPDQWADGDMVDRFGIRKSKGLLFRNPAEFITCAGQIKNKIKTIYLEDQCGNLSD